MKIFALLSVANNHDQPGNNLVCFWEKKPSLEEVGKAVGIKWPSENDLETLDVVKIWQGIDTRVARHDTDYRLNELESGKMLP